jgi:arsenate reductase
MAPNPAGPAAAPRVQIFGLENDQATRAAVRFFKERRFEIHLVDLRRKPIAAGELRRFVQRLGAPALLDTASRVYRDAGLGYLTMDESGIVERLLADSRLLRLPLVRYGEAVSAGPAEATWKTWLTRDRAVPPT